MFNRILNIIGAAPREVPPSTRPVQVFEVGLEVEDDAPVIAAPTELEPIAGYSCLISYASASGAPSERQISCSRLELSGGVSYLRAHCHLRGKQRVFRIDRIVEVVDLHTGEVTQDATSFFGRFVIGFQTESAYHWGLSPKQRVDLVAALNVLAFLARVDGRFHPREAAAIEAFACGYWMRAELRGDPPINDIVAYADRLKPDAEIFYVALERAAGQPTIRAMLPRAIVAVIEADGVITPEEHRYAQRVSDFLAGDG